MNKEAAFLYDNLTVCRQTVMLSLVRGSQPYGGADC